MHGINALKLKYLTAFIRIFTRFSNLLNVVFSNNFKICSAYFLHLLNYALVGKYYMNVWVVDDGEINLMYRRYGGTNVSKPSLVFVDMKLDSFGFLQFAMRGESPDFYSS